MTVSRLFAALVLFLCAVPAWAAPHIKVTLIPETTAPAPGNTTTIAIRMTPDRPWHGYWRNPGAAGRPTQAIWTLPAGVTAGPPAYPVPRPLMISAIMNYVYENDYALLVPLTVPGTMTPGSNLPIRLQLDWLACTTEVCVPENGTFAIDLKVGDGAPDAKVAADFARWRAALPRPLAERAVHDVGDGNVRLAIPLPASVAASKAYFFPAAGGLLDYNAPQRVTRDGDRVIIATKAGDGSSGPVEGVLRLDDGTGLAITSQPGAVAAPAQADNGAFLLALLGAVLGGLLLNIMPCVFPILSLKALSLARSGGDERTARREALAYTAGAVLTLTALGALILVLKTGWAFQMQDPRVVLVLFALTVALTLNLLGLFELPVIGGSSHVSGGFLTGALAAFVATPCTGPFMAGALGAALVLPPAAALAVFAGLGLGLALPFLAIGFVPALRNRLPKPGPWMAKFRRWLALPMAATALWLGWILWQQAGALAGGTAAVLTGIFLLVLLWAGRRQRLGIAAMGAAAGVLALVTGAAVFAVARIGQPVGTIVADNAFSEARLAAAIAARKPVFLYFTADWCLTCKVNERAAIAPAADDLRRAGVTTMVGDWTRGDPAITAFLAKHGRAGVPLYLYYAPGQAEPRVLPQVLTPGMLAALKT
jgi:thiol:disulfide interchange protein